MRNWLSSQDGTIAVLILLTLIGLAIYLYNRDKWVVDMFGGALLLAIKYKSEPPPSP